MLFQCFWKKFPSAKVFIWTGLFQQSRLCSDLEKKMFFLTVGVLVVVRLLGDGIDVLGAVRDHTAVIGETVLDRVVGDSVIICSCTP